MTEYLYDLGYKYRRYPESKRRAHRVYWQRTGKNRMHYYHRDVWELNNGPIPKGYHVHHVDHNYDNNDISNLALLSPSEHLSHHGNNPSDEHREKRRKNLDKIRPLAAEWLKTERGQEHLRNIRALSHTNREKVTLVCPVCSKEFIAEINSRAIVCSNGCKTKKRYRSQTDYINAPCVDCGKDRWRSKYQRQSERCIQCANKLKRKELSA